MRFLLVLFFSMAVPALAADEGRTNVGKLLTWCKSAEGSADFNVCVGYVAGIADLMGIIGASGQNEAALLFGTCGDERFTYGGTVSAFITWAERHRELWTAPQVVGVAAAIKERAPCRK